MYLQIYWYVSSTVHLVGVFQTESARHKIELYSYVFGGISL